MSYAYLFKYIIIGDTGNVIFIKIFRIFNSLIFQEWESLVFCFNLQTKGSNQFMT